ncbi:unnamed protein product [Amoebophrya sp. A120]|nr:unnamed protein product [Amoebophrya sp. A120]|eukprot:GSA120T00006196001.1
MPPRGSAGGSSVASVIDGVNTYIQAGPGGLSVLCFFIGIATMVVGVMGVLEEVMDLSLFICDPFDFTLHLYLCFFGFTAVLLESDAERIKDVPVVGPLSVHLHAYQKFVNEYAHFLTHIRGRGGFYIFIGTFCITECILCPLFLVKVVFFAYKSFSSCRMKCDDERDAGSQISRACALPFSCIFAMQALLRRDQDRLCWQNFTQKDSPQCQCIISDIPILASARAKKSRLQENIETCRSALQTERLEYCSCCCRLDTNQISAHRTYCRKSEQKFHSWVVGWSSILTCAVVNKAFIRCWMIKISSPVLPPGARQN